MSFSPASLRLLREQLRMFELFAQRESKNTFHTHVRPGHFPYRRSFTPPNSSSSFRRKFTTYSTPIEKLRAAVRDAQQRHPVLLPTLSIATFGSVCLLGLLAYDQYTRPDPLFAGWPAPVENQLRMALHFTHKQPNPNQAANFFGGALNAAEQCGMDPFSKEVMGIRIRLAEMLEQFGSVKAAVDVLSGIVKDCEERLTELSRSAIQESLKNHSTIAREAQTPGSQAALLRSIIEAKVKMAQLYDSDYIQDPTSAKKTLSDAIQLLVQNTQDLRTNSFSENNAAGLSMDEIAAMLYDMGKLYSASDEYQNAIEVYILTRNVLRKACNGQASCREVEVLTSISRVMAYASMRPEFVWNGKPSTPETLKEMRRVAIGWANGALETYEKVPDKERDDKCYRAMFSAATARAGLMQQIGEYQESKQLFTVLLNQIRKSGSDPELIRWCEVGIDVADRSIRSEGQGTTTSKERKN